MRPASSRPGRSAKRMTTLAVLWAVITLALAGFGTAFHLLANRPLDPILLCERGETIDSSTLVVVDTTDPLTEVQHRRLRATVTAERNRLTRGGKLTLVAINAVNPGEPSELISVCNPGRADEVNTLVQTASKTGRTFAETFEQPVDAAVAKAGQGAASANSPIIETVAAALTRPDFDRRIAKRRLIIISDMLEHRQGGYSQLKGGDLWKGWVGSDLAKRVRLDLAGVAVVIDYLARPAYAAAQGDRHRRFWLRLLQKESGADAVEFVGLRPVSLTDAAPPAKAVPTAKNGR